MDNGAHFYNCDFQVHTPRDDEWKGHPAIDPQKRQKLEGDLDDFIRQERQDYAEEFIKACREADLDAVAITDHHDTVFFEYIREAARTETDEDGNSVSEEDQITVFPGMELTLGVPCQAIVLFDADLPLDLLQRAQTLLNISQTPPNRSSAGQPSRLDVDSLNDVYDALDSNSQLKGRYIVLPNVTDGGTGTLLRRKFQNAYKKMPCVGGYLDGSLEDMSEGRKNIIRGKDDNYGNKPLGIFQTSDNRRRDHRDLGNHTTWVKWAEPTAEGLRQACLARDSRLWQEEPELPTKFVKRISVSDSLFMGEFELSFNRQYSALIGGRGTGKSTVLEYLRWALGDEPKGEDLSDAEKARKNLIEETLVKQEGIVEVELSINGVPHTVRRHTDGGQFELKVGDQDFEVVPKKEVRELLPIQAYSQKQLSNVAVRIEELNRFVRAPVQEDLRDLDSKLASLKSDLRSTYIDVLKKRELEGKMGAVEREISSVQQQIEQTKDEMTDLGDDDREVLDDKEMYDQEKEIVQGWINEVQEIRSHLSELEEMTTSAPASNENDLTESEGTNGDHEIDDDFPDDDLLTEMRGQLDELFDSVKSRAQESIEEIDDVLDDDSSFGEIKQSFEKRQEQFEEKYSAVRERADAHSEQMQRLDELEGRQEELRKQKQTIENQLDEIGGPRERFGHLRDQWLDVHSQRSDILGRQCEALTDQSKELIRARLEVGGQTDEFVGLFGKKMEGSNLFKSTIESIFSSIPDSDDPIEQYSAIMADLESLALHDVDEGSDLPSTPELEECQLEEGHFEKIARYLTPEDWLDLAVTPLDDQPQFEYKVQDDLYIDFASASAGQQATALLLALLNQSGPPLIIDQPEDDLDNQIILDVVEEIWTAKHERQLIFASHNANLVVNGDADLVVCFDSALDGEEASGSIEDTGAIDVENICDQITEIMEGGQEAFELRKEKYGF